MAREAYLWETGSQFRDDLRYYFYGMFTMSSIGPILKIEGPRIRTCADICKEMSLTMISDLRVVGEAKM